MGYAHIANLYADNRILMFRRCFALEKVHGTSAHIAWKDDALRFFSGGESNANFVVLFDQPTLTEGFRRLGHLEVTVYGEAYGGKQQGMKATYGSNLCFIVFDVTVGDSWLSVPNMAEVATGLGLEVVPFEEFATDIEVLDQARDAPSVVAERRGCGVKPREGIVLRPLIELRDNGGNRGISKHKGESFQERAHQPRVQDAGKLAIMEQADAVAD